MTYEEYKNNKEVKGKSIIKIMLDKLLTVIVFVLLTLALCNISPKFKSFTIEKVLGSNIDFSFINNLTSKLTSVFKSQNSIPVYKEEETYTRYKDGYKYNNDGEVILKSSGIVTYIGNKEGYGNTIVIEQSNGYHSWYGNIDETVKLYDYIESGEVIGSSNEYYYYVLLKNDKAIIENES